jgi:tetratricopeptide (TPR) repeat protein
VAAERERAAADADAARRDRELLERLMDVRAAKSEMTSLAAAAAYAEAFRRSGLDPEAPSFSEAAGWISERPRDVAVSLAAALDDWAWVRRQDIKDQAGAAPLTALARAVDPDPWRNQLRDAVESQDPAARLAALRMLAESASYETLGPVSLDMLGTALGLAGDHPAAEAVLRRAQLRYPGDVWINLDLASTLEKLVRREEAIRYYIAARSIRPESAHELAHALEKKGEHDEAVAVFRELARRRPGDGRHLACFGQLLNERGRKEEARSVLVASAAATREQIRQEPNNATLRSALAQALALQGKFDEAAVEIREAVRLGPDKAGLHYNLSNLLIDQKKPDEALVAIREALRLKPDNVEFLTKLGNILADFKRDYAAAEAAFRDALRLDPDDPVAHHGLGVVLHNVGRLEESTAEFREAVRRRPDDAASRGYLGDLLLKFKRDYAAAAAEFREALRLKPDAADARHGLVVALENLGKLDEASAELREAVRLRPDVVALRNHLGKLLARQGKADDAIAAIREALRLSPDSAEAHTCLGEVLVDLKQEYAAAEAEFREALRLKPAAAEAHHGLGVVLARQGKADDAIAAIRESIRLHPGEANAHANLGSILGDVKRDYAAAEAEFREALRLGPDSAGNRVSLGNILAFQGKTDEAIAELREAIRLGPGDAEVHVRLGDVLGDLKHDYAAAAAAYREAIRLKPDAVESHHGLGVALFKLGKSDEAIAELREALRLRPDNTVSHSTLGLLLEALKKPDEAITEFREAIRLDPDNLKAAVGLVRVLTASRKAPDQIIDALRGAVRLLPDDAGMRNNLAWLLALSPGRPKADYEDALRHARKAVGLKPKEYSLANTLALAEYRVGDWERCIAAAERSMTLGAGGGADDRFFLAMARWRKGDKDEARKRFDEGVAMTKKASPPNSEHLQFWKEAAELLGAPGPDAPEPAKTGDGEAASG